MVGLSNFFIFSCSDSENESHKIIIPELVDFVISDNPYCNLTKKFTINSKGAETVKVYYSMVDSNFSGYDNATLSTPEFSINDNESSIDILGLISDTSYYSIIELRNADTVLLSPVIYFSSGTLPPELINIKIETIYGAFNSGYILTSPINSKYALVFNKDGQIVWYKYFGETIISQRKLLNKNYIVFKGSSSGSQFSRGKFIEFTPSGIEVREYMAPDSLYTDPHDIKFTYQDSEILYAHYFGYKHRELDLSNLGGLSSVNVAGHVIIREDVRHGSYNIVHDSWNHFDINDVAEQYRERFFNLDPFDFDHPNSLDFSSDGNYLISYRMFDSIVKVDYVTGEILWVLGGIDNQFEIINDPLSGFFGQHSIVNVGNERILIYDNGTKHNPLQSRVIEYELNEENYTADLKFQTENENWGDNWYTEFVGSVHQFNNDKLFIGWGGKATFSKIDMNNNVIWEGELI